MSEKIALITGASTGIGAEFAKICAADYDRLVLTARNKPALLNLAKEIENKHEISCDIILSDLSSEKGVKKILSYIDRHGIQIDLLVNNAGFGLMGNAVDLSHKDQIDMICVNVTALTRLSLFIGQQMKKKKSGGIINIASVVGFMPGPFMSVYFASKAYVKSFSESLHVELGKNGVQVTCVCPGATQSEFHARADLPLTKSRRAAMMSPQQVAQIGYEAHKNGRYLVVTGTANKLMTFLTRFMPRQLLARLVVRALT